MATVVWDQSNFGSDNSVNMSNFVLGVDFVLEGQFVLTTATVWLVDDFGTANNGRLDRFSETISWRIFSNDVSGGPAAPLYGGSGIIQAQTDTGVDRDGTRDIIQVDFSFDMPFALDAGTYWFALHSVGLGGTTVWWTVAQSQLGEKMWSTQDVTTATAGWGSSVTPDTAFTLQGDAFEAVDDTASTRQGVPVDIDVLANDTFGAAFSLQLGSGPSHGTIALNDNGTPGDSSDDYFVYAPDAGFHGQDSFTYDVTMDGVTTTATVDITVNQVILPPPPPPPPPDNYRPVILSPRLQNAVEGDKAAFTVEARDPDGDALTYAISGGRDADAFVIDPKTGELSFKHMPDFEWPGSAAGTNAYLVEVSVSDGRLTTAKTFEIDVADVDEARVTGTFGDDRFSAGDSPTHFIGLSGLDAVTFSGPAADYAIEKGPHGMLYVTGPHGTDTLSSIERLQFDDGTLAFDTSGTAGQMFRLYQAAFGREPDAEGLGYWIRHQDAGQSSFEDVARSFMASPEFVKLYGDDGTLSDDAFIGLLYANVLGRDPDPGGFGYWLDKLGAGQTSRPDLLAFFSDSNENVAGTADATGDGVWFV